MIIFVLYMFGSILIYSSFHRYFNQQSMNLSFKLICNDYNAVTLTNVCLRYFINIYLIQIQQFHITIPTITSYFEKCRSYYIFRNRVPLASICGGYFIAGLLLKVYTSIDVYYSGDFITIPVKNRYMAYQFIFFHMIFPVRKFEIFDNCVLQISFKEFNFIVCYIKYTILLIYLRMFVHNFVEKYILNNQPYFIIKSYLSYALLIFEYIFNAYSFVYGYFYLYHVFFSVILHKILDICVLDLYLKVFIYITYGNDFINLQLKIIFLFSYYYYFYHMLFLAIKFRILDIYVLPLFIIVFNYITYCMEYTVLVTSHTLLHNYDEKYKLCLNMISCMSFTQAKFEYICNVFSLVYEFIYYNFLNYKVILVSSAFFSGDLFLNYYITFPRLVRKLMDKLFKTYVLSNQKLQKR